MAGAEDIFQKKEFAAEVSKWLSSGSVDEERKDPVKKLLYVLTEQTHVRDTTEPPVDTMLWKTFDLASTEPKPVDKADWQHFSTTKMSKRVASAKPKGSALKAQAALPSRPGSAPQHTTLQVVGKSGKRQPSLQPAWLHLRSP